MMLKSWQYDVDAFNWIPVASFSFVIFIASWGILSLPFVIIPEILPENLKNFGMTFCMNLLAVCAFIATKFLPLLIDTVGYHGCFFCFAGACLAGTMFILIFIPETKGKSYDQIMESLR